VLSIDLLINATSARQPKVVNKMKNHLQNTLTMPSIGIKFDGPLVILRVPFIIVEGARITTVAIVTSVSGVLAGGASTFLRGFYGIPIRIGRRIMK
jgi:hypothetical protein